MFRQCNNALRSTHQARCEYTVYEQWTPPMDSTIGYMLWEEIAWGWRPLLVWLCSPGRISAEAHDPTVKYVQRTRYTFLRNGAIGDQGHGESERNGWEKTACSYFVMCIRTFVLWRFYNLTGKVGDLQRRRRLKVYDRRERRKVQRCSMRETRRKVLRRQQLGLHRSYTILPYSYILG